MSNTTFQKIKTYQNMQISNTSTALAEALGLDATIPPSSLPVVNQKSVLEAPIVSDNQIKPDADYARDNIIELIQKGSESLDQAMELAREAMHPRMYEVVGQILKVQGDNVDKLLKMHADMKKLNENVIQSPIHQSSNVTNIDQAIIFQGTSDELVRMMRREHTTPLTLNIDSDTTT